MNIRAVQLTKGWTPERAEPQQSGANGAPVRSRKLLESFSGGELPRPCRFSGRRVVRPMLFFGQSTMEEKQWYGFDPRNRFWR